MGSSLRYSPPMKREAASLCVKSKNSKQRVSKYRAQKRKAVIRVESEEAQDDVRERFTCGDFSQEEVNEIGCVPSASSEPRGAIHWRDNQM